MFYFRMKKQKGRYFSVSALTVAPPVGLEPTTTRLTAACSTSWAKEEYLCWRLPIFPGRHQPSIFGTIELNFRVRDGNGWTLNVINTNSLRMGFSPHCISSHSLHCGDYFIFSFLRRLVTRAGIEPALPAWEAGVLTAWPTSQIFLFPAICTRQPLVSLKASHKGPALCFSGAPSGARTRDTLIKSQVLYQLS